MLAEKFWSVQNLLEMKKDISLAPLTTLGIGGEARFFVRAETEAQVSQAVEFAAANSLRLFILGGGSNVLVSDRGFDGLVLQIALPGIDRSRFRVSGSELNADAKPEPGTQNSELITVGAGEDWDEFVAFCVANELAGVECLSGIPGLIGGTPVQNVGAYGQEVSETIVSVRCFDRKTGEFVTLANKECGFYYRTSIFNTTERDRYIVVAVTFELVRGGRPKIEYADLQRAIDALEAKAEVGLDLVRDQVLNIRRAKSMVIDPKDPNTRSAGSFFKNPVIEKNKFEDMRSRHNDMPFYEFDEKIKIPAAWLIENAGFHKGYIMDHAGISTKHTLALINRGEATAAEIVALKETIEKAVFDEFDIILQPEPVFVGF